jgi:hypothetical protein
MRMAWIENWKKCHIALNTFCKPQIAWRGIVSLLFDNTLCQMFTPCQVKFKPIFETSPSLKNIVDFNGVRRENGSVNNKFTAKPDFLL